MPVRYLEPIVAASLDVILEYRRVLLDLRNSRHFHERRNGMRDDDYMRPGISVEIPLFWGTF